MNPRIKQLWIESLESGEYEKGTSRLRTDNYQRPSKFCCLGVLCDLHAKETGGHWDWSNRTIRGEFFDRYLGADLYLPREVIEWAELPDEGEPTSSIQGRLSVVNDNSLTFEPVIERIRDML